MTNREIKFDRGLTILLWHKDGIVDTTNTPHKSGRVYRNGELANTGGKWERIGITLEENPLQENE